MSEKLFISDYTYRTEVQQLATLATKPHLANAPIFRPIDLPAMFRPTQRVVRDTYNAASAACFAKEEKPFKDFLAACRKRGICLASIEEGFSWRPQQSTGAAVKAWKAARINGAAKIGAAISAKNRDDESRKACDAIKDEWPLPNAIVRTPALLTKANQAIGKKGRLHYRTAIKHLGRRPIEQANYQAKLKRQKTRAT
jgi:hypothetical protein